MSRIGRNGSVRGVVVAGLVAFCGIAGAVGAGGARAGEYHVYGCRMPDGSVAPTDGWSGSTSGASVHAEDKCAKGGALVADLAEGVGHVVGSDTAMWTFSPPAGETLAAANLWRAGDAEGGAAANATYEFWLAGPTQPEAFGSCVYVSGCMKVVGEPEQPLAVANLLSVPQANLGEHLYVNASCGGLATYKCPSGKGDSNGYAAVVYLYASDLVLEQSTQPTVTSVEGELATASTFSGVADLSLHAEDPGSGVYQAIFTVDGSPAGSTLIDENSGHCRDVGQTTDSLPAFLYLQPCKASLNVDLPFDTSTLTDGTHHVVVSVTNAAGNSTVALDRKITVLNHPGSAPPAGSSPVAGAGVGGAGHEPTTQNNPLPSNGSNATPSARLSVRWSSTVHSTLTAPYGRSHTILGRLTAPAGSPIASATIQALYTPAYQGASPRVLASTRTASNGSFTVKLPPSIPSSRVTLAYSSHSGQPAPDVTATLTLAVPASLSLRVIPAVSHVGATIAFTGALRGAPLPHGGKQLVLEARAPGSPWRQFEVLATSAHGRYHALYRFRLPGPVTYEFRASSPHEADFPYGAGASNVVRVRER